MTTTRLRLLASLFLVVGCGGSSTNDPGPADTAGGGGATQGAGGSDGGSAGTVGAGGSTGGTTGVGAGGTVGAAGTNGAGAGAGGAAAGGACQVGTPPSPLPTIVGTFIQTDASHMPPAQTGGDATGTWTFDKATIYLPSFAAGLVDTKKSTATGTAWARLDATNYAVESALDISLATSFGAMMMTNDINTTGTYTVSGAMLVGAATCGSMGTDTVITLTRTSPTTGTFLIKSPVMTVAGNGDVYVLLEGAVSP